MAGYKYAQLRVSSNGIIRNNDFSSELFVLFVSFCATGFSQVCLLVDTAAKNLTLRI